MRRTRLIIIFCFISLIGAAQHRGLNWTSDGLATFQIKEGSIIRIDPKTENEVTIVKKANLIPVSASDPLNVQSFDYSADNSKILLFANTAKVWRYNTRGDYWVYNIAANKLQQVGKSLPSQSLMFAKFSPDGKQVAYVSEHNLYSEDLATGTPRKLTNDGTRKMINGTFDWVYEEEFDCRDGFRWSPDSRNIAYWQVNANKIRDYYMLNTTDSVYSKVIPVEYPKVGEPPSPVKIGVVNIETGKTQWMNIEGDPQQHYLPRMEWADANTIIVQQLNRKQQESKLWYCNVATGDSHSFYTETDKAWIDIKSVWNNDDPTGWEGSNKGQDFIWVREKDGWRHLSKISRDGKKEILLTVGGYDIATISCIDEAGNYVYFMASPDNATQLYLYRVKMDGKTKAELLSPAAEKGTHDYLVSPNAKWARHGFSNYKTPEVREWVSLPGHQPVNAAKSITATMKPEKNSSVYYTTVTTDGGITMDAWVNRPADFDSTKKYPVVFYVYGEPAATTIEDVNGNHNNFLYKGDMSGDGYFQDAVDNRGTPALKGAAWRKAIYRSIGTINITDMAMAAKKIIEKPWFDKDRVAVWGWSGGAASTLNLLFKYPEIFKTGIAIAAITNELYYDNIYTERYMGLPQENMQDYINASPITNAKNLKGNLLYIHGTGDDNVQYSNAEALLNELIKDNKQFQFMAYPNRTHNISEGEGTREHLSTLYTNYLKANCAPGGR